MSPLILASTSKYRAALLSRWQIEFEAVDPAVDESPYKLLGLSPQDLVQKLSQAKAQAVAAHYPNAVVIGSDQVLSHENKIFGKAGSAELAVEQLMQLSGQSQTLFTGLCVIKDGIAFNHVDRTTINMRAFTRAEAQTIVNQDRSWDCAGSLKIEAGGTWLIESLETHDPSAIEGLPLIALGKRLRELNLGATLFGG